ncbi:uncharacterized protein LOC130993295 [Salvia miltiorrhiza]|uniref:uncharacterized protein LOC130993295 n=1 Tax=Salvia miltiorrhiza TaxID=226208 RepID=UPI0025ACE7DF|nr:uncharacterized protein LOC130993295 [Salvia miltiorrhiza]
MQMLTHLSLKCRILSIYVDCGVNVGDAKSIDKSINPIHGCPDLSYLTTLNFEKEVYSSSTEDEYANVKPRRKRVVYDKKCDHKRLHITLGMRFEDGYQAKEALTTVAIENGWPLHFSRVCKTRMEANCTPPCKWRCYGSAVKRV